MRALTVDPSSRDGIVLTEAAPPTRAFDDDIVVRVEYAGANPADLHAARALPDGQVPGYEVAGVVDRPARDGSGPRRGARVIGLSRGGSWAEQCVVSSSAVAIVPPDADLAAASTLPVAGGTASAALRLLGPLQGRRVLVTGAAGAVGRFAVQLAAADGAAVVATARRRDEQERLRALGAQSVHRSVGEITETVGGVVESIGGETLVRSFRLLDAFSTLVSVGRASGEDSTFSSDDFLGDNGRSGRIIRTFFLPDEDPSAYGPALQRLADAHAAGRLTADVAEVIPLDAAPRLLQGASPRGKVVLRVSGR